MPEKFFITQPSPTNQQAPNSEGKMYPVYRNGSGVDMMWSGKMPLPAIGDRVKIVMNGIGFGEVQGYMESHGWLGLLVKPENPPEWHRKQTKRHTEETEKALRIGADKAKLQNLRVWPQWVRQGICCVFGAEIEVQNG